MRRVLPQVGTLMLSFGLLLLATGTFNTFIGLRSALEGFSTTATGAMMSAFYVGTMVGARFCGRLINRVGHIRAFSAFAALSAVTVLLHPFLISPTTWILLRGVLGVASAGLYMCTESWLNDRVTPQTRGTVLSLHAMVSFAGFGGGQMMLNVGEPGGTELFMISAMLFALGVVPVALTRAIHPVPVDAPHFGLRRLYEASPSAVVACAAAGFCTGSLFGVGPVFGNEIGLATWQISQLMTALVLSGLFLQFPIGWLSDRYDRRVVISGVALMVAVAGLVLASFVRTAMVDGTFDWDAHAPVLLGLAVVFGGITATLYPLALAYANDYLAPEERVQASGGLVLAYGIGAVGGPLLAALAMQGLGPAGLFAFNAVVALALLAFTVHRTRRRAWAGVAPKEAFHAMPEATATPAGVDYDPRGDGEAGDGDVEPGSGAVEDPDLAPADARSPAR